VNSLANAEIFQATYLFDAREDNAEMIANFLDSNYPLNEGSHHDVTQYRVYFERLVAHLKSGRCVGLVIAGQFSDYDGDKECPEMIVFDNGEKQAELQL